MPLITRALPIVAGVAVVVGAAVVSCGARSSLEVPPPGPECYVDSDCPGYADHCHPVVCVPLVDGDAGVLPDAGGGPRVDGGDGEDAGDAGDTCHGACGVLFPCADQLGQIIVADAGVVHERRRAGTCQKPPPIECDDGNTCTTDACDPATGGCSHTWRTKDRDGDGYWAPLPGASAGAVGSCGSDCNDADPKVHPCAMNTCGVDNDCSGTVVASTWIPGAVAPVRVSGPIEPVDIGGLAYDGTSYGASYTGKTTGFNVYVSLLDQSGQKIVPPGEETITLVDADAAGGPLLWIGDRYGLAWQDRRSGNYDVYFNLLDQNGRKGLPDVQVTPQAGFAVNPAMAWNGDQFIVAWQDDSSGVFDVFAQVLDGDGNLIGANVQLTDSAPLGSESPTLAVGMKTLALVTSLGDAMTHIVQFQAYAPDLSAPLTPAMQITDGRTAPVYPTVVWAKDRYVLAWYDNTASPSAIYAAAVGEDGTVIVPPTPITNPGTFHSRYPSLSASGNQIVLVYSDDRDQAPGGYQLYMRNLLNDLTTLGPELRVTNSASQDTYPTLAFGGPSLGGILYRSDAPSANFQHDAWFIGVACVASGP
jgi:hypothetical protein